MRILILVLALACLFGLAAMWHQHRIATKKDERDEARRLAAGEAAETEVGIIREGWGVVLIGKPAGAEPPAAPNDPGRSGPITEPGPGQAFDGTRSGPVVPPPEIAEPADLELVVQPGQSLSKIAAAQYGTSKKELVDALARYNGLASADALQSGFKLKLPSPAKLQAFAASR